MEIVLRLVVAGLMSIVIGQTNQYAYKKLAGRLFAIICMGACLLTIISMEFFKYLALPWSSDPGRISAQVISALGFLVTGLIWIADDNDVKGLSAAASLWFTAILGIMVGAGLWQVGFIGAIFLLLIFYLSNLQILNGLLSNLNALRKHRAKKRVEKKTGV